VRTIRGLVALAAAGTILAGLAACSASAHTAPSPVTCGATRTGANVPVTIKIVKGTVSCAVAMRVENGYAAAVRDGKVMGNGGGAPVKVDGWTCEGYRTPDVLRTGNASECHTGGAEVVAVVEVPSPASS
jgi:hypothetical protein